jgi:hypothetical protein
MKHDDEPIGFLRDCEAFAFPYVAKDVIKKTKVRRRVFGILKSDYAKGYAEAR